MSCKKVKLFPIKERNQNYPYNKASRIAFTSFKDDYRKLKGEDGKKYIYEDNGKMVEAYPVGEIMIEYFSILKDDFSRYNPKDFEESIDLTEEQKNELTDLIFNYGYQKDIGIMSASMCYMPRNAILFFDENDNLFEFIMICFDCNNYRTSKNELINLGEDCSDKMIMLQNLFAKAGIKYGTKREY